MGLVAKSNKDEEIEDSHALQVACRVLGASTDGKAVKKWRWWFNKRMKQLVQEHYPGDEKFFHSDQWFWQFCCRWEISLHQKHQSQKTPDEVAEIAAKFHKYLLNIRKVEHFNVQILPIWTKHLSHSSLMTVKHTTLPARNTFLPLQVIQNLINVNAQCNLLSSELGFQG